MNGVCTEYLEWGEHGVLRMGEQEVRESETEKLNIQERYGVIRRNNTEYRKIPKRMASSRKATS